MISIEEMNDSEIGIQINSENTKIMAFAQTNPFNIYTTLNSQITIVDYVKYLGLWMNSSLKYFEFRKALAWKACHKMKKLWESNQICKVTIETILLYGS